MSFLALPLFAADLSSCVRQDTLARLRAGETITASVPADSTLTLLPSVSSGAGISAAMKANKPTVGVEVLRLIAGANEEMDSPSGWLRIYNTLHAVSTMQGIKYYSVTRRAERVLFSQSYVVSSAQNPVRIDDPVFATIPTNDSLFTLQQDGSFGRNTYEESFAFRGDHLVVTIGNLTTITFLLIPFIQPHNMVSNVVVVPVGKDVLFYGLAYAHTSVSVGDRRNREESLANRLIAMANWLKAELIS
jgi:hypothetical protein